MVPPDRGPVGGGGEQVERPRPARRGVVDEPPQRVAAQPGQDEAQFQRSDILLP